MAYCMTTESVSPFHHAWWSALCDTLAALRSRIRLWRTRVQATRAFNALDAATLRDLGMSRGEVGSYWAEQHGQAAPTRRRIRPYPRAGIL
jgi:uncharacterized protein YjiS (DUF1127 family)